MKVQSPSAGDPAPDRQFGDAVLRSLEAFADKGPGDIQKAADRLAALVRKYPLASVLAAGAAGAILGLTARGMQRRHE